MTDLVADFHRSRRMFCIVGDNIFIAPMGDPRGHYDWMKSITKFQSLIEWTMETCVRGYFLDNNLYLYSGCNFLRLFPWDLKHAIKLIADGTLISPDTVVHNGVTPGEPGDQWLPIETLGPISEHI